MRRVTRNALLGLALVVVLLLALGALPSLLKSGDPYYLVATATDAPPAATDAPPDTSDGSNADGEAGTGGPTGNETIEPVDASDLPSDRYRYTTAALANATADSPGRSPPYWRGPVGFKGAFTHSPFDEIDAIAGREPNATDGDAVFVRQEGTTFRLAVVREDRQ